MLKKKKLKTFFKFIIEINILQNYYQITIVVCDIIFNKIKSFYIIDLSSRKKQTYI